MRRPGFLSGFEGYTPKATAYTSFRGLGAFGKGFVAPPPGPPPPGGVPGGKVLTHAVNKQTGKFYVQDPQCPEEGTKMMDVSEACQGMDCCDAPGDCDPPGTVYTEKACDDDPQYRELPLPPPGGWANCEHRKSAGYPDPCDKTTCPECFAEKPKQQPQAQPQPQVQPKQVEDPAIRAKMQAELQQLEAEAAAVEAMPKVSVLAPPSAYTGGGMPSGLPRRARKQAPTREQRVKSIVSDFETRRAMQRTLTPAPRPSSAPAPAPRPSSAPAPLPPPPVKEDTGGLFSWLKRTLFGGQDDYVAAGLGEHEHYDNTKLLVALAALFILLKVVNKK